ncbi:hypothetical protein [Burkholderia sp. LMG 32019]|uniref:hypothetical protein n=1 Tax=Burkholderia sp. LMG 32019 TaxID=3158173 RepID=UPI003C30BF38
METFQASTQYGDWRGSAAADRSDATTLADLLLERGLRTDDEFLVGAELYVGENHDNTLAHTIVAAYLVDAAGFDNALQAIEQAGPALTLVCLSLTSTVKSERNQTEPCSLIPAWADEPVFEYRTHGCRAGLPETRTVTRPELIEGACTSKGSEDHVCFLSNGWHRRGQRARRYCGIGRRTRCAAMA